MPLEGQGQTAPDRCIACCHVSCVLHFPSPRTMRPNRDEIDDVHHSRDSGEFFGDFVRGPVTLVRRMHGPRRCCLCLRWMHIPLYSYSTLILLSLCREGFFIQRADVVTVKRTVFFCRSLCRRCRIAAWGGSNPSGSHTAVGCLWCVCRRLAVPSRHTVLEEETAIEEIARRPVPRCSGSKFVRRFRRS